MKFDNGTWRKVKVSDLGRIVTGKTPKTSNPVYYGGDIPFLTPSDDMSAKYVVETKRTLTTEGRQSVKNMCLPADSVCVSCIGSDLGNVVVTTEETITNQQVNSIIVDKANYDVDFVYYAMSILGGKINYISKTSTAVPIVNKTSFSSFTIDCPDLHEQKKISQILAVFDDKINNNNAINKNLIEQAQAIYTDIFISKSNPVWNEGTLTDLVTVRYGKDHKKLDDGEYPVYGSGGIMRYVERPLYDKESVLIPRKGTLNNVMYVNEPFWSVDTMFYTEMKRANVAKFVYHFVKSKDLASLNAGSAVPSMTTAILDAMPLLIPDDTTLERFEKTVAPIYETIQHNTRETTNLATLRDTLLPRLISGEIDVSSIEI